MQELNYHLGKAAGFLFSFSLATALLYLILAVLRDLSVSLLLVVAIVSAVTLAGYGVRRWLA